MKLYSQMDPAWKLKRLGESRDSTIGSFGCLLTCMSMVGSLYGHDLDPLALNVLMKDAGGFQGAYIIPAVLPQVMPGVIFRNFERCSDHPAPLAQIDASIAQGKPVIIEVDYSPRTGMQNHWLVLYARQGNDYLLRDPYPYPVDSRDILLTRSRYNFAGEPRHIISAVVWFDGTLSSPPPIQPPTPPPGGTPTIPVYVATDDLALRTQSYVSPSNLIRRLHFNEALLSLEPEGVSRAKLLAVNEWLYVQDANGQVGYVAAWYLAFQKQIPPTPPVQPPTPPTLPGNVLYVKTTVHMLALRSEPRLAPETLVKYLPLFSNLCVLEPLADAQAKIGITNQWLHVEDISAAQGYIAAWLITTSDEIGLGPVKEPEQPPTPDPTKLIVRPTTDGLALRSQPYVNDTTLIKRLPLDSDLAVLDPVDEARLNIGSVGNWFKVRDITGAEGFVAAWYVLEVTA